MLDWILRTILRLKFQDITGDDGTLYLRRFYVYRGKHRPHVFIHHILRSDYDRACHNHPWKFTSLIFWGSYREIEPWDASLRTNWAARAEVRRDDVHGWVSVKTFQAPALLSHTTDDLHRLELDRPAWTMVFAGPRVQEWGFMLKDGWVHWTKLKDALMALMGAD